MEHMKVYASGNKIFVITKGFSKLYSKGKIISEAHGIFPISFYASFKLLDIKNEKDLTAHILAQRLLEN